MVAVRKERGASVRDRAKAHSVSGGDTEVAGGFAPLPRGRLE